MLAGVRLPRQTNGHLAPRRLRPERREHLQRWLGRRRLRLSREGCAAQRAARGRHLRACSAEGGAHRAVQSTHGPPKGTDSRTKNWQGEATCQLEALPPDVLASLLDATIKTYINLAVYERDLKAE